ncbi:MAG: glycosyltransferase family 39 protein, partial [Cyanobacteria bacterium J06641_5]
MKGLAARDAFWLGGLLLGAIALLGSSLDGLPLRDWDEATVAQVAREIWQAPAGSQRWLFPTLWDEPYFNKPPLVHNAIAWTYQLWGDREGAARLPGAVCTGLSVLCLYGIGRELFPRRQTAFFGAALYLTALPVVRHGRLAMLDGAVLCFATLACWCLLRARRDLRWSLGAGLAWGLLCLTKGVALGGLFGAIALGFLAWDTPRLLASPFWWGGMILGSVPAWGWYWVQSAHAAERFVRTALLQQNFSRIWTAVDLNSGPPWYYLDKLLQALPGLPIFWAGIGLA